MFICDKIVGIKTTVKTIKMYFSKIGYYASTMSPLIMMLVQHSVLYCHKKSTGYNY